MRAKGVVPEGMSVAPEGKQVLRACGAQDDSARSLRKGRNRNLPFLPETRGVCHPERARGTRASEGPAGTAGGGPSDRLITDESEGDDHAPLSRDELHEATGLYAGAARSRRPAVQGLAVPANHRGIDHAGGDPHAIAGDL